MKKLLVCLLALCALTFTSCNPEPEPINYADDFVGEYIFSITPTVVSEEYGSIVNEFDGLLCKITETFTNNVTVSVYQGSSLIYRVGGICDVSGMRLGESEFGFALQEYVDGVLVTLEGESELGGVYVKEPVGGTISWVAPITLGNIDIVVENITLDAGTVTGSVAFEGERI